MNKISKVLLGTFASFALAVPFFVSAQEVEEVVVTATKKAESVQDLALSIEAFTAEGGSVFSMLTCCTTSPVAYKSK